MYLRIAHGLTQSDMGNILGCSRFQLARKEKSEMVLSFQEWWRLVSHFGIAYDSFLTGVIAEEAIHDKKNFAIPTSYAENSFSFGRALHLHIDNYKHFLGEKAFVDFCESEKVDPTYFVNINNSLNINFNLRLIQQMVMKGFISNLEALKEYTNRPQASLVHHFQTKSQIEAKTGIDRIYAFQNIIELYEKNHDYKIIDYDSTARSIVCSFRPKEHVDMSLYNGAYLKGFFCHYVDQYYQSLSSVPLYSKKMACFHKGAHACVYQYNEIKKKAL